MKLNEIMTKNVQTARRDTKLTAAAKIMSDVNCGALPVVDGEKVVGVVTDRDIVLRAVARAMDTNVLTCGDCMTADAITVSPDMDAHEAASLMASKQIRRLPVVENGKLVGIVALGDLATVDIHVDEAGSALSSISVPSEPGAH